MLVAVVRESFLVFAIFSDCRKRSAYNPAQLLYLTLSDILKILHLIGKFLEVKIDEARMNRVLQRTSFVFMKKHEAKFGEQPEHWKVYDNFIRNGKVGEGKTKYTEEQVKEYRNLSKHYKIDGTVLRRYFV